MAVGVGLNDPKPPGLEPIIAIVGRFIVETGIGSKYSIVLLLVVTGSLGTEKEGGGTVVPE